MVSVERVRELALGLPEAAEADHHGRPSFRVAGRIFATLWTSTLLNVMVDQDGIRTAVAADPEICSEVFWGQRLAAVRVRLDTAGDELVGELLADAWERKAPPRLAEELVVDRMARRPSGARAREVYGAEDVHLFARRAILGALDLTPSDRLLEIGCGGGLLLRDAMSAGAAATGIDHSAEMVALASARAPGAAVLLGQAQDLPFADADFTAVAMSVVFMFFADPLAVLDECRRILAPRGRLALYTTSERLRGTPAAPEPIASHAYFYDDGELAGLARTAGFSAVAVSDDDGGQLLTARRT